MRDPPGRIVETVEVRSTGWSPDRAPERAPPTSSSVASPSGRPNVNAKPELVLARVTLLRAENRGGGPRSRGDPDGASGARTPASLDGERWRGFDPAATRMEPAGLEPTTSWMQTTRSPS